MGIDEILAKLFRLRRTDLMTKDEFLVKLSRIMEDTAENNESIVRLGNIQTLIDEQLIPMVDKIGYENKYDVIDNIKKLCRDISIYTFFPKLINKNVFCFYEIDKKALNSLNNAIAGQTGKMLIDNSVPTFVNSGDEVSILNIAQKCVSVSVNEYEEILRFMEKNDFDLAGIVHTCVVPSDRFKDIGALLCIPENADKTQKFYLPVFHSSDVLIVSSKKAGVELIESFSGISSLIVYGNDKGNFDEIKNYCSENNINVMTVGSFGKVLSIINLGDTAVKKSGSLFSDKLEKELYELMWYLADCKIKLENSFEQINENLLYKDNFTGETVQKIKTKYSNQIEDTDKLYKDIRSVSDLILEEANALQCSMNITDTELFDINLIEELIIKKSLVFKAFPEKDSKEIIRKYCNIYGNFDEYKSAAHVLLKDFLGESIDEQDKKALLSLDDIIGKSDFMKHKIVEFCFDFYELHDSCINIVQTIKLPLTNIEMRLLGEYYLRIGVNGAAKENLMAALKNGDLEAGEIYREKFVEKKDTEQLTELANLGVGKAAMQLGKQLYKNIDSTEKMKDCLKYLTIAAASGRASAAKVLGDIYYEEELTEYLPNLKNDEKYSDKALRYYLFAEKSGCTESDIYNNIADLYFDKSNYTDCIKYCEKSGSGYCQYLQGKIYRNGLGTSQDNDKALKFFEIASNAGIADAQVEYERLVAEINEAKKKTTVSYSTDYSSYSYYSGYYSSYSSYSSGW